MNSLLRFWKENPLSPIYGTEHNNAVCLSSLCKYNK